MGHPLFEHIFMLKSFNTDLATMSLIWICFNRLGFTLLIAAVAFCFRLIFQIVLPICPFSPTPQVAIIAASSVFDSFSSLLNPACGLLFFSKLLPFKFRIVTRLFTTDFSVPFSAVRASCVFRFFLLLQNHSSSTSDQSTQITCQ